MNNKNKLKIAGSNPPFKGGRGDFLTLKIISFFLFLFTQCTKKDYNIINLNSPNIETADITHILTDSATVNFKIINTSKIKFNQAGICYDTNDNPTIAQYVQYTDSGVLAGNYSVVLPNLLPAKKYYVRGFSTYNNAIYYGNVQSFTTNNLPIIALNILNITNNTATINWVITNSNKTNITKVGIYYSTSNMLPGTNSNDSTKILNNTGSLAGTYSVDVNNLIKGSTYYIRFFYVINGVQYLSPQVQSFTAIILPTIATNTITNITKNAVTTGITITNVGNVYIAAAGLCYSKNNTIPTLADSLKTLANTGVLNGIYPIYLSNLSFNTVYYVRSYYTINGLTYYGNVQNFTTLQNIPQVQTDTAINITNNSATINFSITNETGLNITAAGIAYSSSNTSPTTASGYVAHSSTGNLAGNYTLPLSSLSANTIYYYRAYINYNGTIYYGAVQTFTTLQNPPTITTNAVTSITNTTATGNINISNPNGLSIVAAGIVYSNINNIPTISDNFIAHSSVGNLAGNYTLPLSSLSANTIYYYRAYINYNGTIYYGAVQTFTTLQNPPTITTNAVTSITNTTAIANINISNPNGLNITAAGVAYSSTNSTPTTADAYIAHSSTGNLAGNYTLGISSLSANTTYYIRAYINYNGAIYYGTVQTFTTTNLPTTLTLANLEANMVTVPAGSFTMGATNEQLANNGDGYRVGWSPSTQQVTLSSYKICRFEVTQQLWQDVMGSNPSYFKGNLQRPVEGVSWNDCQIFIDSLNKKTGKIYRLPTEAEWEYVARGGANSTYSYIYSGGNTLNDVAWNYYNSSSQTQTVGTKQANALGLYDMSSNVWEWCNDWYGDYSSGGVTNPQGAASGSGRVIRGGSWKNGDYINRVSYRHSGNPSYSGYDVGIRLVLSSY